MEHRILHNIQVFFRKNKSNLLTICLIGIVLTTVYLLFGNKVIETFQRMNYIQLHDYLDNIYKNGKNSMNEYSPYRKRLNSNVSDPSVSLTGRYGYSNNSEFNLEEPKIFNHVNQDRLIGYLYSQDTQDNEVYKLYEVYDYKRGRPGYAYKNSKDSYQMDEILVNIDPKKYSGDQLYDGDVVNITHEKKPFVVKLYKIKNTGLQTRYTSKDYRSDMYEYALLEPVNTGNVIDENDKYFILYEQTIDPRRELYNYYIKDKRGILLDITDKPKKIYDGDTLLIPGKEKIGQYKVSEIDKY